LHDALPIWQLQGAKLLFQCEKATTPQRQRAISLSGKSARAELVGGNRASALAEPVAHGKTSQLRRLACETSDSFPQASSDAENRVSTVRLSTAPLSPPRSSGGYVASNRRPGVSRKLLTSLRNRAALAPSISR